MNNFIVWLKISLRNIIKNARRSMFTVLAISFGLAAINLFQGYTHSTYKGLTESAIYGEGLGHLTVFKKGFLTHGKLHPEEYMFARNEVDKLMDIVKKHPSVKLITPRLALSGIISNGKYSTVFIGQGTVPSDDLVLRENVLQLSPVQGDLLDEQDPEGVLIASELAEMLSLKQGEYAVVMSNTLDGMANALDVRVRGIFNTGSSSTNDKLINFTYQHALDLYDINFPDRLVILLTDKNLTDPLRYDFMHKLQEAGFDVEIKTWYELSEFYSQVKGMFDTFFFFVSSIVLVISVLSIINTMTMSIMERTREIGTLRALGVKQRSVRFLFSIEGVLLGFFGSIIGICIFFAVYWVIRIVEPSYIPPAATIPAPIEISILPFELMKNLFFILIISFLASFLPARKASRLSIIDALGHV
ncbi:MAG: ABC transporter permease [Candidatus Brocadiaceae bacterium]|nr:ABC transporter permease [Candidatus Brocadiaceae bacterium]